MNAQPEKNPASPRPQAASGIVPCLIICATVAFVAWLALAPKTESQARRLWLPVAIETNGQQTVLGEMRQMEFWTPSAKTRDFLSRDGGDIASRDKWQVISNDDVVLQFGILLHSNANVFGYRRTEVMGQGRTIYKPGWWWTMNVTTNYSEAELARAYQGYWKPSQAVLIEVIDNRGSKDR